MRSVQDTRLARVQTRVGQRLRLGISGPWAHRSAVLIALLAGFFLGETTTVRLLSQASVRTIVALYLVTFFEMFVRLRSRVDRVPLPLHWQVMDNIRVGFVYSVVLEAFKVGS